MTHMTSIGAVVAACSFRARAIQPLEMLRIVGHEKLYDMLTCCNPKGHISVPRQKIKQIKELCLTNQKTKSTFLSSTFFSKLGLLFWPRD